MSFPTTGVLDNFNRSNTGPPLSASWSAPFSGLIGGLKVVSNQAVVDAVANGWAGNYYNVATYGPNCEAHVKIVTKSADTKNVELYVRGKNLDGTSPNGYFVSFSATSGTDTFRIYKVVDGTATSLVGPTNQEISNGDSIGISAVGTTLKSWYKPAAGSWTEINSVTDSTFDEAGNLMIMTSSTSTVLDDFGGGTIVSGSGALPMAMNHYRRMRN